MNYKRVDIERVSQAFTAADVERTLTVPEAVAQYPSAELHSQWPGVSRNTFAHLKSAITDFLELDGSTW